MSVFLALVVILLASPAWACSGSTPSWTASNWADIQTCHDGGSFQDGDTITLANKAATEMLPGYKEVRPMVFCGLYPVETSDYEKLKAALGRLRLNGSY